MRAMSFTINEWAILALVFILGWLLGLASRSDKRWRRQYEDERTAHQALRRDHDTRINAANARIIELERHQPAVTAGTAGAVGAAAAGRRDDLTRIDGIDAAEETRLNDAGIHGYRDLATISADDAAALEARLGYGRGRIESQRWREQAAALAGGYNAPGVRGI
jgi:predicted flap endonuclease-1-like 5' DNA nuclease